MVPNYFITTIISSKLQQGKQIYVGTFSNDISILGTTDDKSYSYSVGDSPSVLEINSLNPSTIYAVKELCTNQYGSLYIMTMNNDLTQITGISTDTSLPGCHPSSLHTSPNNNYLAIGFFTNGGGVALYSIQNDILELVTFHQFDDDSSQIHAVKFINDHILVISDYGLDKIYLVQIDIDNNELLLINEYKFDNKDYDDIGTRSVMLHSLYNNIFMVSLQNANGVALFNIMNNYNDLQLMDIEYFSDCSAISDVRIIDDVIGVGCRKCGFFEDRNGCVVLLKLDIEAMDMTLLTYIDSGGETPRSFDFISYNKDMNELQIVIGNQDSNNVIIKTVDLSTFTFEDYIVYSVDTPSYILYQ